MRKTHWDGNLPVRRYAIFCNIFCEHYSVVITGNDIHTAHKWGGFVSWLGGIKPAESRKV